MEIETIRKLLDAGYTKAEIDAMQAGRNEGGASDESAGNTDQGAGEESSGAGANPENAQSVSPDIAATIKALTDTVNGLTETVKAIQNNNIGKAATDKPEKSGIDDVMKSFIEKL